MITPTFETRYDDFLYCEQIIKKHSKSFYAAFSRLPDKMAKSIFAIYTFCRQADDLIDEQQDLIGLNELEDELLAFYLGSIPDDPMWRALEVVFDNYPMDILPFFEMIQGQRMDYSFNQPKNMTELLNYCYHVAGTVGLMLLPILAKTINFDLKQQAIQIGYAMQLTNILRDIGEDYDNHRLYLPKVSLAEYTGALTAIKSKKVNSSFIELWESYAFTAENYYDTYHSMLLSFRDEAVEPFLAACFIYRDILTVIRQNDYDCLSKKQFTSSLRKMQLMKAVKEKVKEINDAT